MEHVEGDKLMILTGASMGLMLGSEKASRLRVRWSLWKSKG
jgi:hypothetical protein